MSQTECQQSPYLKRLESLETKLTRLELAAEWRRQFERFEFYEPCGKIEHFIDIISNQGSDRSLVYILSAANGVGKTAFVVNLIANLIWPKNNKYFAKDLFTNWPYPKRIRYITDPELVKAIGPFHSEIKKFWPAKRYTATKSNKGYFSEYEANGWIIDVMTYEQELSQFEGGTLGLIILDEPPPRDIFNACISRFRGGGFMVIPMTPLTHAGYIFDEVVPNHKNHIVYATMEDACKQHGVRGHLEHDFIKKMIDEMPPDEVKARAFGEALYLSGLIYSMFDPEVHVLKERKEVPANATVYQSVDPHSDKPFASIWGYPDSNGDFYITHEWPKEDFTKMRNCQLTIQDYKNIFSDIEGSANVTKRIIDRHFADVRSAVNKRTLREELRDDVGLDFEPSYKAEEEIETGILAVRSYLKYDKTRPISALNKPKLFINPDCYNTIRAFQRWSRDPKTGKVQDSYKDFMDCVRMLLMENPEIDVPMPDMPTQRLWGQSLAPLPDTRETFLKEE